MTLLDRVQTGRQRRPLQVCIYGVPGVGKTTFGASAPNPLIYCLERGADNLDVSKLTAPDSWEGFVNDIRELATTEHGFKTLVIDTLDALEPLVISYVCEEAGKKTLADFGFGSGYFLVVQQWRLFLSALDLLRDKRDMNIVLIAHEHRKSFSDPSLGSYEQYRPKLQDRVWGVTNEWCDNVLFAQFDEAILEEKGQRSRAIVTGRRVLRTTRGTGYVAKNRFSLPPIIDLDWLAFETATQPVSVADLKTQLNAALAKAGDEMRTKAASYLSVRGETPETLRALTERVEKILNGQAA